MFSKVLIANRGEIAVRIIHACREMGIRSVAVYSSADADALHVQLADEAYCVGPPPALESYLNVEALLDACRHSGAEAVHPGYGFLAESADFARRVQQAGLVWIGPPPDVIALMGDKVAAKELAERVGVPVVPGYHGVDQSTERLCREAQQLGFPLMVKAAAGGGGKGMRVVASAEALPAAVAGARREAYAAFADDHIFLEKLFVEPRHIEIQIVADTHGNYVHLGERDCSIQRRHQKVVEEAPSPVLGGDLRAAMGEDAVRFARAGGYVNVGTVEFLFSHGQYYFLEMNTRIQVEHPVTEMVTGLDLVRHQIAIAAGESLTVPQSDISWRGHAIEARLYAEDAQGDFLPATGELIAYRPPIGPGIRNEVGVVEGGKVGPHYDPLLAKVVVQGETREQAIARLCQALERYVVLGVTTNLGFLHWVSEEEAFRRGNVDTGFIAAHWEAGRLAALPDDVLIAAAALDLNGRSTRASQSGAERWTYNPWRGAGSWRVAGVGRSLEYEYGGRLRRLELTSRGEDAWEVVVDQASYRVRIDHPAPGTVILRQGPEVRSYAVSECNGVVWVARLGAVYQLRRPQAATSSGSVGRQSGEHLSAPMPATVSKVVVQSGQRVVAHELLVVLEAMKMEHVISAPHDGVVTEILYSVGDLVPAGSPVVTVEAA